MRRLLPFVLLGVAACETIDTTAAVDIAVAEIEVWNAMGVDPINADANTRAYMAAACSTTAIFSTLVAPQYREAVRAFCEVAGKVAE